MPTTLKKEIPQQGSPSSDSNADRADRASSSSGASAAAAAEMQVDRAAVLRNQDRDL